MDEFIKQVGQGPGGTFELWAALVGLALSFLLSLMVAYFYRVTHRGLSYSVAFVHTMVIMSVTISIIMTIIGSNIARAFALVGALSIIRFRNAVKDSRDVAFIFVTIAIGMATGTGFYAAGMLFTLFVCAMIYFLFRFNIGASTSREMLLKIHLPADRDFHTVFDQVFFRSLHDHTLLSVESIRDGALVEVVYSIQFKRGVSETKFLDEIRELAAHNKVVLLTGQENVFI